MKKLFALVLAAFSVSAAAQTTNISVRVTVDVINAGVTNSSVTTIRLNGATNKDTLLAAGAIDAWSRSKSALSLDAWLAQDAKDRLMEYARAKLQADNADLAAKLVNLLTSQQDLLSAGDLTTLRSIGAKAP